MAHAIGGAGQASMLVKATPIARPPSGPRSNHATYTRSKMGTVGNIDWPTIVPSLCCPQCPFRLANHCSLGSNDMQRLHRMVLRLAYFHQAGAPVTIARR